jgi:uncharacterized protein
MRNAESHNRIDYIEINVKDIKAAKAFYGNVFGWEFQDWGPDYASFNDGRMDGGLRKVDEVVTGSPLVIFYSKELEKTRDSIVEAGGKIIQEIFDFPGGRRFHFQDNSGNELAVWSE